MPIPRIFLIGPMGAGKTTIGKKLAARLRLKFADADWEIQRQAGMTIAQLFKTAGEKGFRDQEELAIARLTQIEQQILAIGGGGILRPNNRQHLANRGCVIYLHCSPKQQFVRTQHSQHRPLLQTPDPLARLQALMLEREPLYRAIADYTVVVERQSPQKVVKHIIQYLQSVKLMENAP